MVRLECGCGHILYEDNKTCPICGRSLVAAPVTNKAFHELGAEPDCACYKYREGKEDG
jgi:hypothetical protein